MTTSTAPSSASPVMKKWQLILAVCTLSMTIGITGYYHYASESQALHETKRREIQTIAELKVDQLSQWHEEKLADARVISMSPIFIRTVKEWIAHPSNLFLKEELKEGLRLPKTAYEYDDIFIASPSGRLLLSVTGAVTAFDTVTIRAIQNSTTSKTAIVSDLYRSPSRDKIHFVIFAPIRNEKKQPIAVLVFCANPDDFLYPLIRTWPTPSKSSETLLLRKDGNGIIFLNNLRYMENTALRLRIPLTDSSNPGVRAVQGFKGIYDGIDYRGIHVLAYLAQVPHTQWILEAKVDYDEIFSEIDYKAAITGIVTVVSILFLGAGFAFYYRSRQKNIYQNLFLKEKELREYHEEFRTILYSIGDGVITTDIDGMVKKMNHTAAALTGWDENSAEGRRLDDVLVLVNEETRQRVENPVDKVLREGAVVGLASHTLLIAKDGRELPIADSGAPIRNELGEIEGAVLVFRDKSDEHEAKLQIVKSEEKYRIVADNTYDWEFWINPRGQFVYNSPACKRTTGYDVGVFLKDPDLLTTIIHEEDRPSYERHDDDYHRKQLPGRIEFRILRADGTLNWIEHVCNPVFDDNGAFLGTRGSNRDITERKQIEDALKESEQYLKDTQSIAEIGTYTVDIASGKWKCSEILETIFGIDRQYDKSVEGWGAIIHPEWRQCMMDYFLHEVIGKKIKFDKEYKIIRQSDKAERWVHGMGELKFDDRQQPVAMIGTITDITRRKEAEENLRRIEEKLRQSEKMEAVGQLAGGIAHDFNNVLGGIVGFAELSLKYADNGSTLEGNLNKILKAADRAKRLVMQILAFSRQGNPQKSITDVTSIIKEVNGLLRSSIPSSVIIETELDGRTTPVMADPTQIHQVLLNLATNAVQAMNRKGTLTIKLYPVRLDHAEWGRSKELAAGAYTVIEVADTGCGMDAVTLSKAFEPFFTTKAVGEGTGMGLSVVLGIVQSHGGDIQVESEVGHGTTMRIFLPAIDETAPKTPATDDSIKLSGSERILFVDDEAILVDMAESMLSRLGYSVTGFLDSQVAMQFIKEHSGTIDILITDQTMPGMTGIELAKEALKIRAGLPIILCTGFSNDVNSESAAAIGISHFLMKPYGVGEISRVIRDVLDSRKEGKPYSITAE